MPLTLSSLSVSTESITLLDCVDACLMEGERVGLVGGNSCGKSTLLSVIAHGDGDGDGDEKDSRYWTITSGNMSGSLSPSQRDEGSVLLVNQDVLSWSRLWPGIAESGNYYDTHTHKQTDNDIDTHIHTFPWHTHIGIH